MLCLLLFFGGWKLSSWPSLSPLTLPSFLSIALLTFAASDVARSASVEGLTVDLVEGLQQSGDSIDIVMPSSGQSFSADTASMEVIAQYC